MVSIVVPFYNASRFITETLDSILAQDFKDIELILVNDCSTDNTLDVLNDYFKTKINLNFTILNNEVNRGVSFSRNRGLKLSKGEYIVFFDADDLMSDGFLSNRVKYLDGHPDIDGCCSNVLTIYGKEILNENIKGIHKDVKEIILQYTLGFSSCPSNYMYRRNALGFHDVFYNENLQSSADKYFLLEVSQKGLELGYLPNCPLIYRIVPDSMSHSLNDKLLADNKKFASEVLNNISVSKNLKRIFQFKVNYTLSGGYWKLNKYGLFFLYGFKSLFYKIKVW